MTWSDIGQSVRDVFRADPDQDAMDARMHDPAVLAAERDEAARAEAHRLARAGVCAACGGRLGVLFSYTLGRWTTYCREDVQHDGVETVQERAERDLRLPPEVAATLEA